MKQFEEMDLILPCYDLDELGKKLEEINWMDFRTYQSNTQRIISSIEEFIEGMSK